MSENRDLLWIIYCETVESMMAYDAHFPAYETNETPYDPRSPAYNPTWGSGYAPPYDVINFDKSMD